MELYRAYLRDERVPIDQIDGIIGRELTKGIPEPFFCDLRDSYLFWASKRRKEKARKAAHKRWSQERRHKANAGKLQILREALDIDKKDETAF